MKRIFNYSFTPDLSTTAQIINTVKWLTENMGDPADVCDHRITGFPLIEGVGRWAVTEDTIYFEDASDATFFKLRFG